MDILAVIALIVSILAIVVTVILYYKSARDLKSILDYLRMAINNPDVTAGPGQKGIPRIWNVKLHPAGEVKNENQP